MNELVEQLINIKLDEAKYKPLRVVEFEDEFYAVGDDDLVYFKKYDKKMVTQFIKGALKHYVNGSLFPMSPEYHTKVVGGKTVIVKGTPD